MLIKKSIPFIILLALIFINVQSAYAQRTTFSREFSTQPTPSIRALGMGGAFYGVSDDKYSAFYNPAGLAKNKDWSFDIPIVAGMNNNMMSILPDIFSLASGSTNPNYLADLLSTKLLGKYINATPITFFPAVVYKNWSVGLFANANINAVTYNPALPQMGVKANADFGVMGSFSYSFLKDKTLHFGVSLVGLWRMATYFEKDVASLYKDGANFLSGIDFIGLLQNGKVGVFLNAGLMYELPYLREELNFRASVSFNNLGYGLFNDDPLFDKMMPTMNLSLSISPSWEFISSNIVLDFTDLFFLNGKDNSFSKRINFGAELGLWNRIFLRVGVNKGYFTCGFGFDIWALRINYAYYTEELGAYGRQYGDTRHAFEIILGWKQQKKKETY